MMTRLVLVGMVAALGITVPTWSEVGGCITSLHSWTACRLADWDTARSRCEETGVAARIVRRPIRVFEPIVPDDTSRDIAYGLNRMSEGLDALPEAIVVNRCPRHQGVRSPLVARMRAQSSRITTIDTMEEKLMTELVGAIEQLNDDVATTDQGATHRAKSPFDPPTVCVFTASPRAPAPVRAGAASADKPKWHARLSGPKIEVIEPLIDGSFNAASVLNRFGEGIELSVSGRLHADSPHAAFVSIDPTLTGIPSLADELNRLSEGVPHGPHPAVVDRQSIQEPISRGTPGTTDIAEQVRPAPPIQSTEVALAMRLTRDALHAWMKVMAGPAFVQVSSR